MATSRSGMEKRLRRVPRAARIRLYPVGAGEESVPGQMLGVQGGMVSVSSPRHEGGIYRAPIEHIERFTVLDEVVVGETRGVGDVIRGAGMAFVGFLVGGMILSLSGAGDWPVALVALAILASIAVGFYVGYRQPFGTRRSRSAGLLSRIWDLWHLWRRVSR